MLHLNYLSSRWSATTLLLFFLILLVTTYIKLHNIHDAHVTVVAQLTGTTYGMCTVQLYVVVIRIHIRGSNKRLN